MDSRSLDPLPQVHFVSLMNVFDTKNVFYEDHRGAEITGMA